MSLGFLCISSGYAIVSLTIVVSIEWNESKWKSKVTWCNENGGPGDPDPFALICEESPVSLGPSLLTDSAEV